MAIALIDFLVKSGRALMFPIYKDTGAHDQPML